MPTEAALKGWQDKANNDAEGKMQIWSRTQDKGKVGTKERATYDEAYSHLFQTKKFDLIKARLDRERGRWVELYECPDVGEVKRWCVHNSKHTLLDNFDACDVASAAFNLLIRTQRMFLMLTPLHSSKATKHLKWTCTCQTFSKQLECHHALWLGMKLNGVKACTYADGLPFTEKRGVGRPQTQPKPRYCDACDPDDEDT